MQLSGLSYNISSDSEKNIRIRTDINNPSQKYIKLALKSTFDNLEVLSLKLSQKDVYRLFNSEYGVVAGRVLGNGGTGIPNAKISIFIPLDNEDKNITYTIDNIKKLQSLSMYPYEKINDKDNNGKRYNLLPKYSKNRGYNGFKPNDYGIGATPLEPIGNIPDKEELLSNDSYLYVFDKYLQYTTVSNESGDFMLYGVPIGKQTLHCDVDITDIGKFSVHPLVMSKLYGLPDNLFDENGNIIKNNDIDKMPNIQQVNLGIDVLPFWNQDTEVQEVGITRQDINIPTEIKPSFTIFGGNFTMGKNSWWGRKVIAVLHYGWRNLCQNIINIGHNCDGGVNAIGVGVSYGIKVLGKEIAGNCFGDGANQFNFNVKIEIKNIIPFFRLLTGSNYCQLSGGKYGYNRFDLINHGNTGKCSVEEALKVIPVDGLTNKLNLDQHRTNKVDIKFFTLNPNIDEETAILLQTPNIAYNFDYENDFDINKDIIKLTKGKDYIEKIDNGKFLVFGLTNRKKMITDEEGNLIESVDPRKGIYTEFRGSMIVEGDGEISNPDGDDRTDRIVLKIPQSFDYNKSETDQDGITNKKWIGQHSVFEAGKIYSVAQKIYTSLADMTNEQEETEDLSLIGTVVTAASLATGNVVGTLAGLYINSDNQTTGWDNQTGIILDVNNDNFIRRVNNKLIDYSMPFNTPGGTTLGIDYNIINNNTNESNKTSTDITIRYYYQTVTDFSYNLGLFYGTSYALFDNKNNSSMPDFNYAGTPPLPITVAASRSCADNNPILNGNLEYCTNYTDYFIERYNYIRNNPNISDNGFIQNNLPTINEAFNSGYLSGKTDQIILGQSTLEILKTQYPLIYTKVITNEPVSYPVGTTPPILPTITELERYSLLRLEESGSGFNQISKYTIGNYYNFGYILGRYYFFI